MEPHAKGSPGDFSPGLSHSLRAGALPHSLITARPCGPHPTLEPDPSPALQLGIVQRLTVIATGRDQHAADKQLSVNTGGRRGIPSPCGDTGRLSEDVVSSASHLPQLVNRFGKVVLLRGMLPPSAV
jgi:hypothetical protein